MLPQLALVPGEPSGIGPELCIRLAQQPRTDCRLLAFADPDTLHAAAAALGLPLKLLPEDADAWAPGELRLREIRNVVPSRFGQPDAANARAVIDALLGAGRAVMALPAVGELGTVGRRVLFCWDERRESARALADAGPILEEASELFVLRVDPPAEPDEAAQTKRADFLAYCAGRQYPIPQETTRDSAGVGIGNCILNAATDNACDLIVMGAYGHSRVREAVLGGTTRTMLESMTVPVLFSH